MPTTISAVHTWTATTAQHIMLPALAQAAQIVSIRIGLHGSAQIQCQAWFGLTSVDQANAANMASAARLIDRGNIVNDGKPSIQLGSGLAIVTAIDLPIFHTLAASGMRLMVGLLSANIATKSAYIIATLNSRTDLEGQFGIGRIIQAAGVAPSPISATQSTGPVQGQ